jgi:twitching motility protein PilT
MPYAERGQQVETSGYQPASPEPSEEHAGFSPAPLPATAQSTDESTEVASAGWNLSFVADQPEASSQPSQSSPFAAGPPLAATSALEPQLPAAAPVAPASYSLETEVPAAYSLEPAAAEPAGSHAYKPAESYLPEQAAPVALEETPQAAPVALAEPPAPVAPAATPPSALTPFPTEPLPAQVDQAPAVQIAESEATEAAYQRSSTETEDENDVSLNDLLMTVLERGASDLHMTSGARPALRINGALVQMEEQPILTPPVIQRVIYAALTQKQREKFEENLELDFAYSVPGRARFRVNVYRQRDALGAAFRIIPFEIKKLEDLGVPPSVANFAQLARGFVLVTGPTGSGKSTTLASLIDMANRTRSEHIMTVEDPIEFLHRHQKSLVNQREVGEDTWSFTNALKHVLRQDPDIILVGEMRDLETISVALTAAETGHLVFATLHTQDAAQTIDRIIDVFPPEQQQQVRVQLAGTLQGIVCQSLAKTADGLGRAVATEVLVATPAVRNLIREGKTHQIYSAMQAGAKHGMHTMDQHLADLVKRGRITHETGIEKCHHIEDFNRLTGRG